MKFYTYLIRTAGLLLAGLACNAAVAASITIYAGYDYSDPDYISNSYFTVVNDTGYSLSDIVFTAIGDGDSAYLTDTATWTWSESIAAGESLTQYFPEDTSDITGTGWGFTIDYGWEIYGNDQTYTFSALLNGVEYTATFSPLDNDSGAFVAFLANDEDGEYLPEDVYAQVASASVSEVPLPATAPLLMSAIGFIVVARKRRTA